MIGREVQDGVGGWVWGLGERVFFLCVFWRVWRVCEVSNLFFLFLWCFFFVVFDFWFWECFFLEFVLELIDGF